MFSRNMYDSVAEIIMFIMKINVYLSQRLITIKYTIIQFLIVEI
jgi:hypothetical protein